MGIDPAVKLARGTKRICVGCEVRFYDLRRSPIICPSCGVEHVLVSRRAADAAVRTTHTAFRRKFEMAVGVPETIDPEIIPELESEIDAEIKDVPAETESGELPEEDMLLEETGDDPVKPSDLGEPIAGADDDDR